MGDHSEQLQWVLYNLSPTDTRAEFRFLFVFFKLSCENTTVRFYTAARTSQEGSPFLDHGSAVTFMGSHENNRLVVVVLARHWVSTSLAKTTLFCRCSSAASVWQHWQGPVLVLLNYLCQVCCTDRPENKSLFSFSWSELHACVMTFLLITCCWMAHSDRQSPVK